MTFSFSWVTIAHFMPILGMWLADPVEQMFIFALDSLYFSRNRAQ
ncbi:MAG: hypothetical protein ACTTH5_08660 [Wolinella sp.]